MSSFAFVTRIRRYPAATFAAVLTVLLLVKFFLPYFVFDVPLGYDAGIYRFLFLRYAESLMHAALPVLDPWAQEHPPGLFLFTTPLLWIGISPDALIGWIWNVFPVALLLTLAATVYRRTDALTGALVLLMGLLSQPLYDGFVAMYWKAFLSLLFVVLAYDSFERKSWLFYLFAFFAVITHHQTGLVIALAVGTWWLLALPKGWRDPYWRTMTVLCALLGIVAIAIYAKQWERAFWSPLKSIFLLRGDDAPGGAFPDTEFYLRTMSVTLALGALGFVRTLKQKITLWHYSVFWCAVFIVFRLVFYRRFFLQIDFFLLPFAAAGFAWLWRKYKGLLTRSLLLLAILVQVGISVQTAMLRRPIFSFERLSEIIALESVLPADSSIIALENQSGPWLLGWLPEHRIGAPGLFDLPGWTYEEWEGFLYGTDAERKALLERLSGDVYFYLTPAFIQYYGEHIEGFLHDRCLRRVENLPLIHSECTGSVQVPSLSGS